MDTKNIKEGDNVWVFSAYGNLVLRGKYVKKIIMKNPVEAEFYKIADCRTSDNRDMGVLSVSENVLFETKEQCTRYANAYKKLGSELDTIAYCIDTIEKRKAISPEALQAIKDRLDYFRKQKSKRGLV